MRFASGALASTAKPVPVHFPAGVGEINKIALSLDGRLLAVAGGVDGDGKTERTVPIFDVATGRELRRFRWVKELVSGLAFTAEDRYLIASTIGDFGRFELWDLRD